MQSHDPERLERDRGTIGTGRLAALPRALETAYLLRSPANDRRLLSSIAQRHAGKGTPAGACRAKPTSSDEAWKDSLTGKSRIEQW